MSSTMMYKLLCQSKEYYLPFRKSVTIIDKFIKQTFSTTSFQLHEKNLRNIGIMAHIDAGKTTTTERMLFYSGCTRMMGEVHDGTTVTDFMDQERERGITITSAAVTFPWKTKTINLIDTPGHVDFTIEVERSLRILDGAVAVFDASAGVEAQSITVWLQANRYELPRIAYLNKMDKETASLEMCLEQLEKKLDAKVLLTQRPIGHGKNFVGVVDLIRMNKILWDKNRDDLDRTFETIPLRSENDEMMWKQCIEHRSSLVEQVADLDNPLAEMVLEKESTNLIPPDALLQAIRRITINRTGLPLMLGSSYKNIGVQPLMDAICDFLPSPLDKTHPKVDLFAPKLCAVAFKIFHHKKRGPMTFIRIYSGRIQQNQRIYNASQNCYEKVSLLYSCAADDLSEIRVAQSGSILVASGLKITSTGDTLIESEEEALKARKKSNETLMGVKVPEPVFMCSIEAPSLSQQKTLDYALSCLEKEDPSLRIKTEEDTGQTVLAGMGELHLSIIIERIRREHKIEAELGPLYISYRETMLNSCLHTFKFDKVIGETKQSITMTLSLNPHKDYKFKDLLLHRTKDTIENLQTLTTKQIKAVARGIQSALLAGPVLRFPVIDIRPELHSLYVKNRTSETMISAAASSCVQEIFKISECVLLEPVMKIELVVPEDKSARLLGELSKRRALIDNVEDRIGLKIIESHCPLVELVGFASSIRQLSSGTASISMEFAYYRQMTDHEREEAILKMSGL